MKILYTNFHYGHGGGHTTYILNLLRNPEHEKYVACPPSSSLYRQLHEAGYDKLVPLEFPSRITELPAIFRNARALRSAIERHAIDIVHTNGSADNRLLLYARPLCRKEFKVVFTKHNTYPISGLFSRWRFNRFNDAVIVVATALYEKMGLADNPRCHLVENGIDLEYWRRRQPPAAEPGRLRLVSCAGTSRHKGWTHLMDALDLLDERERERISVTVLGRDNPLVREARGRKNVFFPGFIEDARPYLEGADAGFILSYHEASSFALREMLAMGLPVITSDFAGHEVLYDPACCWKTRLKDPVSISRVLRELLALTPEDLEKRGRAARQKAKEACPLEAMIARTNAVYATVAGAAQTDEPRRPA